MIVAITEIFSKLSSMLAMNPAAVLAAAFVWGMLSILLSPCHLSSIPLAVGYINGRGKAKQSRTILLSLFFSTGIFFSLLSIGAATAAAGKMLGNTGATVTILAGLIFIIAGLSFFDIIRFPEIPRIKIHTRQGSNAGAFLLGAVFGTALGPCTFGFMIPVLAAAFQAAPVNPVYAAGIVISFAAGHSFVIVFAGIAINSVQSFLNWNEGSRGVYWFRRICGACVIGAGLYLILKLL